MTKREAKIEALGYIISIADVSLDHDDSIDHMTEVDERKVCHEVQTLLDAMRDRLWKLKDNKKENHF